MRPTHDIDSFPRPGPQAGRVAPASCRTGGGRPFGPASNGLRPQIIEQPASAIATTMHSGYVVPDSLLVAGR